MNAAISPSRAFLGAIAGSLPADCNPQRVSAGSMPQGHGKNGFPFIWLMEKVLDNLHGIKGAAVKRRDFFG